jgi:hypothetical protein
LARHLALRSGAFTLALAIASPALGAAASSASLGAATHVSAARCAHIVSEPVRGVQTDAELAARATCPDPAPGAAAADEARAAEPASTSPVADPAWILGAIANRRQAASFPAAFIFESHTSSSLALGPAPLYPPAASPERPARGLTRAG